MLSSQSPIDEELAGMELVEFDRAIVEERFDEIKGINQEMIKINSIQKDIAALVESQEKDIQHISQMSTAASENTQNGLSRVMQAGEAMDSFHLHQRSGKVLIVLLGIIFFIGLTRVALLHDSQNEHPDTDDEYIINSFLFQDDLP